VRSRAALAAATLALACAPALREPPALGPPPPANGASADELLRRGDAAWARRSDPAEAAAAQTLYEQAASADEKQVDGLLGAMRAAGWRIEREKDGAARERLAVHAVELGQWCQRRAPASPACAYRLAIALGQQTRERSSTAKDALARMVKLLREAIAADPRLDRAGPHRVLALVLLRAPGWPVGPGDPEEGLHEAQAAAELFPDDAENQLTLGEALAANGHGPEARAALERAVGLAQRDQAAGDPDAARVREDATAAIGRMGRG
jgi:tetratricopeptide (TPR) repeat protein